MSLRLHNPHLHNTGRSRLQTWQLLAAGPGQSSPGHDAGGAELQEQGEVSRAVQQSGSDQWDDQHLGEHSWILTIFILHLSSFKLNILISKYMIHIQNQNPFTLWVDVLWFFHYLYLDLDSDKIDNWVCALFYWDIYNITP